MSAPFAVGDVVRVKGGGRPSMTVESLDEKTGSVGVLWFAGDNELKRDRIDYRALVLVTTVR